MKHPEFEAIVFDFSKVILFTKDPGYQGSLNALHRKKLSEDPGYNFFDYFDLDTDLLDYLGDIKSVPLYLFTSSVIQEAPAVKPRVDAVFGAVYSAERLGVHKEDPGAYRKLCDAIGIDPRRVLFVDDSQVNLDQAQKAGLVTHIYKGKDTLKKFLAEAGIIGA